MRLVQQLWERLLYVAPAHRTAVDQGLKLLIQRCVQHLKRRLPLRQITFRNKFGVQATVDELPVQ